MLTAKKDYFKIFCPRIYANWREYFSFLKIIAGESAKWVFIRVNSRKFAGKNFFLLGYAIFIPLSNVRRLVSLSVFFVVFFLICFGKSIPIKQNAKSISAPIAVDDFYYVREPTGNGTVRRLEPVPGIKTNDITDEQTNWQLAVGGGPNHASGLFPDYTAGGFQYISQGGYVGSDSFTYQLMNTSFPYLSDTAVVTLDIFSSDGAEDAGGYSCPSNAVGQPVNVTNGNMWIEQSDYALPGIGENIEINRFYNSIIQTSGHFGFGWSTKYDESLVEYPQNAQGRQMLRVNMPDGRAVYFARNSTSESYKAPMMGFFGEVVKNADQTFTLNFKDGRIHQFYSNGKLNRQKDRNGNETILDYNGSGHLTHVRDAFGRILTLFPNSNGTINKICDGSGTNPCVSNGVIATYTYYENTTKLQTVTYNDGSKYQFDYLDVVLSNGQTKTVLTTVKDAVNNILEKHEYDGNARATTSEKSPVTGNPQPVEKYTLNYSNWTSATPHTVVTDANGKITKYFFDKSKGRNLITKTEGVCGCGGSGSETTTYEYDMALNLTKKTDALGRVSEMIYDTSGNLLAQTDKVGATNLGTQKFTYNQFGQVLTYQDKINSATVPATNTLVNQYDANGNLSTTTDALGNVTTISYPATNNKGLPDKVKDARLNETKLKWFSTGLLEEIEDANLKKTNFTYDGRGRIKTVTNALQHTTTYNYFDDTQRKVEMIYPNTDKITYKYDIRRLLESVTDERGKLTNYEFDTAYRLTKITDALGHTREVGYDLMSNLLWSKDGENNQTDYVYDDFNRLKEITYPLADVNATVRLKEKFEYDTVGRIKKIIDTANRETVYNYDDAQRTISVTNAENETTQTKYNARQQAIEVKDALNQIYTFTYNPFGQILTQTRAGGTMSYEYDETLNRKKRTDYAGRETTYEYDNLNRLKKINYLSAGNAVPLQTAVYNYDDISRLTSAVNEAGTVNFGYDNRNRQTSTTDVFGHLINYEYERTSAVNQERLKFNGANYANYNFDDANRLTNIVNSADSSTISFGYDNADRLTSRNYPNGVSTTYGYDNMSRLKSIKDINPSGTLFDRQYGYNNASQINQITEPTLTKTIGYDNVNRLTSVIGRTHHFLEKLILKQSASFIG